MAYVILVNLDNTLTASKKERIMQRSKLFDTMCFLADPIYKGYDMSVCTVVMEYLLPVSKEYKTEVLELSDERYEDYLKYLLPFDTNLTREAGDVELQLTFIYADMDENGKSIQRVRKTSTCKVHVWPISAWSDIIPDSALTALDQRIIKVDSQIKALEDTAEYLDQNKADDLKYDAMTSKLQLLAGDKEIGKVVTIVGGGSSEDPGGDVKDVVEF